MTNFVLATVRSCLVIGGMLLLAFWLRPGEQRKVQTQETVQISGAPVPSRVGRCFWDAGASRLRCHDKDGVDVSPPLTNAHGLLVRRSSTSASVPMRTLRIAPAPPAQNRSAIHIEPGARLEITEPDGKCFVWLEGYGCAISSTAKTIRIEAE